MTQKLFKYTVVAGTFDRLHKGHKRLLKTAIQSSRKISCGLTTQKFIDQTNKPLKNLIQPYAQRLAELKSVLPPKTQVVPLDDPFGPAITEPNFDSIVFTQKTLAPVKLINQKRQQKNLKPLKTILVELDLTEDGQPICSAQIRLGQVNRQGQVYSRLLPKKLVFLPKDQRHYFKKPLGQILKPPFKKKLGQLKPTLMIAVGDVATQTFVQAKIPFNLAIFDYRVKRQPIPQIPPLAGVPIISVKNPAGCLHPSLLNQLKKTFAQPLKLNDSLIRVEGEEDLTIIPVILLSPLNSLIFYGQPDQGLVQVQVTEQIKTKIVCLLSKFS